MRAVLDGYLAKLRDANAAPIKYLAAPASAGAMASLDQLNGCDIPDDLRAMWSVFNGMAQTDGVPLGALWLDGTFMYYAIAQTLTDYAVSEDLWASDEGFEDYLPKGFLPIATPGDGSRLLVNCRPGSPTHGAVYELFHGIGLSKHAASLKAYFETVFALFNAGAITVDDDGCVDFDPDRADGLAAQMNPDCDAYDDDLPPAYELQDWLAPKDKGLSQ